MSKQFTRILLAVTITAIVMAMVAFFFAIKSSISLPQASNPSINIPSIEIAKKDTQPKFNVYLKDKKTLVVEWRDLPFDTVRISLYRSKDQKTWEFWKDIPASTFAMNGNFEIKVNNESEIGQYYYRAEAMSGVGDTVWQSGTTPISNAPLPTSTPETASNSSGTPNQTNTTGTVPNPGQTVSPTSSNPSTTPPTTNPNQNQDQNPITRLFKWIFYYNPQGQLIGTSTMQSEPFWVNYADQESIEIGWQNLPSNTNALKILRSTNENGPWLQLLYQQSIDSSSANSIRITDHSTSEGHYYRMEALHDYDVLQNYGPVFLPAYK